MSKTLILILVNLLAIMCSGQVLHTLDKSLPCIHKRFDVSVNVVLNDAGEAGITLEDIIAEIDTLNYFFSPICVSFDLCNIDTIINYAFDILNPGLREKLLEFHHHDRMLNISYVSRPGPPQVYHSATVGGILDERKCHVIK